METPPAPLEIPVPPPSVATVEIPPVAGPKLGVATPPAPSPSVVIVEKSGSILPVLLILVALGGLAYIAWTIGKVEKNGA